MTQDTVSPAMPAAADDPDRTGRPAAGIRRCGRRQALGEVVDGDGRQPSCTTPSWASCAPCRPPSSRPASARRSPRSCATRSRTCIPNWRAASPASRNLPPNASSRPPTRPSRSGTRSGSSIPRASNRCSKATPNCRASRPSCCSAASTWASSWCWCMALRGAPRPAALWQELHAYYRLAEMLDCAVTAVSDELTPNAVGISCYSTYCHALLLGLADPWSMSIRQIELTDRWLSQWARKVFPYAQQRETGGPGHAARPRRQYRRDARSRGAARSAAVDALRLPGQARHQRPRPPEAPRGRRQSRRNCSSGTTRRSRAARRCCRISTRTGTSCRGAARDAGRTWLELVTGGVPAAYFRVGGRTFDRQDPLGRLTFQGAQHLQTLGALTDYDRYKDEAERNWPWERWQGSYEWRDARARAQRRRPLSLVPRPARRSCATTTACAWAM